MPPTGVLYTHFRNEISDVIMKDKEPIFKARKKRKTLGGTISEKDVLSVSNVSPKSFGLKRKRYRASMPAVLEPKRLPADENLVQSGGEEEFDEAPPSKCPVSKASTSKGEEASKSTKKGEYYVKNAEGVPAEKYSMVYRNTLHNGDDIDDDSGDELPGTSQILLSDKWKADYNNGVQILVNPEELPRFETKDVDFQLKKKSHFELPSSFVSIQDPSSSKSIPNFVSSKTHITKHIPFQRLYQGDNMDVKFVKKLNMNRPTKNREQWLKMTTFLDIMDSLEIEAYKNIHEILLKPLHSPATRDPNGTDDEAACDVCRITECDVDDEMVFCDGCNVCVHMSCYGLTELPAGEWLCLKCILCHGNNPPCVLCPTIGGAMKCTKHKNRWAHVVCALWLPECRFGDVEKREPILAIEEIADERWQLKCSVCDTRQGACIQCTQKGCNTSFHVTCALRSGFTMRIEQDPTDPDEDRVRMVSLCKKHSVDVTQNVEEEVNTSSEMNDQLERLQSYFYLYADYEKIAKRLKLPYLLVSDVYEYWKQKRKENGGKPLIADPQDNIVIDHETINLTLPSTSTAMTPKIIAPRGINLSIPTTPNLIEQKRSQLRQLRSAVDKDRIMMTMVLRREKLKRQQLQTEKSAILELCEFATKNVVSTRAAEGYVEMLEEMLTPEEISFGHLMASDPKHMEELNKVTEKSTTKKEKGGNNLTKTKKLTHIDSFLEEEWEEEEEKEEKEEEEKEEKEEINNKKRKRKSTTSECSPRPKRSCIKPSPKSEAPIKRRRKPRQI